VGFTGAAWEPAAKHSVTDVCGRPDAEVHA
jgi:hypothetical protein